MEHIIIIFNLSQLLLMPWDSSPLLDRRTSNSSNERIFSVNCDNNENDDVDEPGFLKNIQ